MLCSSFSFYFIILCDTGRDIIPIEVEYKERSETSLPRAFDGFIEKYASPYCLVVNSAFPHK